MVDIFISYKREDRAAAEALANRLSARGYDVWWDAELLSGDAFITEIYEVLKRAKAAIVLWSEGALGSRFVIGEALWSLNHDIYLGAMLEPIELPPPFNVVHNHDMARWRDDASAFDGIFAAVSVKVAPSRETGDAPPADDGLGAAASEVMFWRGVADSGQIADIEAYLSKYGDAGLFAGLARQRIEQLGKRPSLAQTILGRVSGPPTPETAPLPAGRFMMGSPDGAADSFPDETPQREVVIGASLAIGRGPVTFEQYDAFCAATGRDRANDQSWGRGARPAVNVSWRDAVAYCEWLSGRTGARWRLPSEAEWEYAARAGSSTAYFWGDAWERGRANGAGMVGRTTEVGAYPPNTFELSDMAGNVWEWCADDWCDDYTDAPPDGRARLSNPDDPDEFAFEPSQSVIRGGSWDDLPQALRSAMRGWHPKDETAPRIGFRVVRET